MLPALLDGIRGEIVLADGDDACNDRDYLCDVLAKGGRRCWTADPVDDVLDRHHNGVGLSFKVRLEEKKKSAIHKTVGDAKTLHL